MTTNSLLNIVLLPLLLIGQISWAMPTDENPVNAPLLNQTDLCLQQYKYSDLEPSEKDNNLSGSVQLLKLTLKAFQELSLNYAKKALNISEHLLKDPILVNSQKPKILEFKDNITEFQEQYTLCEDLDQLFDLVELYSNTTSFYYDLEVATLDEDTKLILNLLRKYGSEDLDNEFEKYFNIFVNKFDTKLESLVPELKKEEGHAGKDVLAWYETFQNLKSYDDKIEAFERFFSFYEDKKLESFYF